MAKKIRFPLKMKDGTAVRRIEELREHFDLESMLGYFADGKLQIWLANNYYDEMVQKVMALSSDLPDLNARLCEILGVDYSEQEDDIDFEALQRQNEKLRVLREVTDDQQILDNVDAVAFDQDELFDILDEAPAVIYLFGDKFSIPYAKGGITYIGVNNPEVILEKSGKEYHENEIVFQNVRNDDLQSDETDKLSFNCTIQDAEDMILEGRYQEAFPIFQHLAENGDARAMYHMARYYFDGYNTVKLSELLRNDWLRKAYILHEPISTYFYARYALPYRNSVEQCEAYHYAYEMLRKQSEEGDVIAQSAFISLLEEDVGTEKDRSLAVSYIKNAAEKGYAYAQYYLGMMYYYGKDVCPNYYNAYEFYHKAAEQGHALAQFGLAQMIEYKRGLPSSYYHDTEVSSEKWFYQAAQQGYEPAQSKSVQWRLSRR